MMTKINDELLEQVNAGFLEGLPLSEEDPNSSVNLDCH